ncbi:hypothetical protein QBC37DRAFT_476789 [Rhypophila decipiens]|uniref:Tat pathway signal sequence n=1 Tax=Rhypophila decipiens TaxID=261697 RepID=A0AAN6XWG9_9PEZI|nr:hypothetical protein QBC37DRAFT_476789 [Rhypophila decipiens]
MPLLNSPSDEKTLYSLVGTTILEEVNLHGDDDNMVSLHNEARVWRRRFNILLFTLLTTIALLIGAGIYAVMVLGPLGSSDTCTCVAPGSIPVTSGVQIPYTPAPVEYVNKHIIANSYNKAKFMGHPRPELDEAWSELLAGTMMRFSDEELMLAGNATSIRHKEGGFVGGLGVSHSLHCLKRIKQYLHPEYYYNDDEDMDELWLHLDHCLESLRQQLLCSADVNIYTLRWTPHSKTKPSIQIPQAHACVNWDHLHSWMLGRAAKYEDLVKQE